MTVVLDAWALVAFLNDEPAGRRVEQAWLADEAVMCSVNLGEVLHIEARAHGEEAATAAIDAARADLVVADPTWAVVRDAALLKARGGVSFAACFALATARARGAPLWTGDPEILAVAGPDEVVDLR